MAEQACYPSGMPKPSKAIIYNMSTNFLPKIHVSSPSAEQDQIISSTLVKLGLVASQPQRNAQLAEFTSHLLDSDIAIMSTQGKDFKCLFLAGYAYALGIPIVYFCPGLTGNFNLMLSGSAACVATTEAELEEHLIALSSNLNYTKPYLGTVE